MKKNYFCLLALATALLQLSSCSSSDDPKTPDPNTGPAELKISANMQMSVEHATTRSVTNVAGTTMTYTNLGIFVWKTTTTAASDGYGYQNVVVSSSSTISTKEQLTPATPLYFPADNSDVDVYLYAPRSASPSQTDMKMAFAVQADQASDDNYKASDFIYGKATATYADKVADVTLYHALSKVRFVLIPATGLSVTGLSEIKLTGVQKAATINMPVAPGGSAPWLTWSLDSDGDAATKNVNTSTSAATGDVIVANSTDVDIETHATTDGVAAVIPPQAGTGINVQVTIGLKYAVASLSAITFDAGKAYTINLNIQGSGLTVNVVEIKDWTAVDASDLNLNTWNNVTP